MIVEDQNVALLPGKMYGFVPEELSDVVQIKFVDRTSVSVIGVGWQVVDTTP